MSSRIEIDNTFYCYQDTLVPLIEEISGRVRNLRSSGRLTPEVLYIIRRYFRIKNIYHSNAIEGNVLSVGETRQVVESGLTLTGVPLKDQAEAKNLAVAIDFLESLVSDPCRPILEADIRQLHKFILKDINDENAGKFRNVSVTISGSKYKPRPPESIASEMECFCRWIETISCPKEDFASVNGLLYSAIAHTWLVYIHPFIDGNGRVARLLMNLILMRYGYPIAIVSREDRMRYYDALEESQSSNLTPFISLLCECLHESLEEYEKAVKEQREREEWAKGIADKFTEKEKIKASNEYEVWKSAVELLKGYMKQTSTLIGESTPVARIYFKDFGILEFEKYLSFRSGGTAKKTWFFRIDFKTGDRAARYLFFFGWADARLRKSCDVTLHLAREEPSGSFNYERLDNIKSSNVPDIIELGYDMKKEEFVALFRGGTIKYGKIEELGRRFFEEVIKKHFSS